MGQEDIIVTATRVAGQVSGNDDLVDIANVGGEVLWRVLNPAAAISDAVTDGIRALVVKDGMGANTAIGNDIAAYQAGMDGADMRVMGIAINPQNLAEGIAGRIVPASFLIGDTRKVLDARDLVEDHKDLIRGMAERGVPGFAHEILLKDNGQVVEAFAQVPLDGGKPVTYVDDYKGPQPLMARTLHGSGDIRDDLTFQASDSLEHWAMRVEGDIASRIQAEGLTGADAAQATQAAVTIAYQQLKGNAIREIVSDAGVTPALAPTFTVAAGAPPATQAPAAGQRMSFNEAFSDMTP